MTSCGAGGGVGGSRGLEACPDLGTGVSLSLPLLWSPPSGHMPLATLEKGPQPGDGAPQPAAVLGRVSSGPAVPELQQEPEHHLPQMGN